MKQKFPNSIRKYIRKEKARIRREVLDSQEQEKLISELYQKFTIRCQSTNKHTNDTNKNIKANKNKILV